MVDEYCYNPSSVYLKKMQEHSFDVLFMSTCDMRNFTGDNEVALRGLLASLTLSRIKNFPLSAFTVNSLSELPFSN